MNYRELVGSIWKNVNSKKLVVALFSEDGTFCWYVDGQVMISSTYPESVDLESRNWWKKIP